MFGFVVDLTDYEVVFTLIMATLWSCSFVVTMIDFVIDLTDCAIVGFALIMVTLWCFFLLWNFFVIDLTDCDIVGFALISLLYDQVVFNWLTLLIDLVNCDFVTLTDCDINLVVTVDMDWMWHSLRIWTFFTSTDFLDFCGLFVMLLALIVICECLTFDLIVTLRTDLAD